LFHQPNAESLSLVQPNAESPSLLVQPKGSGSGKLLSGSDAALLVRKNVQPNAVLPSRFAPLPSLPMPSAKSDVQPKGWMCGCFVCFVALMLASILFACPDAACLDLNDAESSLAWQLGSWLLPRSLAWFSLNTVAHPKPVCLPCCRSPCQH
jgi:hypothetical protein